MSTTKRNAEIARPSAVAPSPLSIVLRVWDTIRWGERLGDKARIACFYALRNAARLLSGNRRRRRGTYPELWIGDIRVSNPIGRFVCRARTIDFDIVNPNVEALEVRAFRDLLERPTRGKVVCFDVGAHIGKFSVLAGRALGSRGEVVAFEPEPSNFALLTQNLALNGLAAVRAFNVACGQQDGEGLLFLSDDNTGAHSIDTRIGEASIRVRVRSIDSLLAELDVDHVDVIKLDVEHAEAQVIRGAWKTLQANPGVAIFFEETRDPETAESIRLLRELGFSIKWLAWRTYAASRGTLVGGEASA